MTAHPICLVPAVQMSWLVVQVQFHLSTNVAPANVHVLFALPYFFYVGPIPSGVSPSTRANPSLLPPFSIFISAFANSSCHVVASSPLLPKLLCAQVGMLRTWNFFAPLCRRQSSSCLCHALVCLPLLLLLQVLSRMLLHTASLTIQQRCRPAHWAWRSCNSISMSIPLPNDIPCGSTETVLSQSDVLQNIVGQMDCSFKRWMGISWSPLLLNIRMLEISYHV